MTANSHPTSCSSDAATLAAAVRELARTAHRTLHDPTADPAKLREIARGIALLQVRLSATSATPLAAWLVNLRRKVEARERNARPGSTQRRELPTKGRRALAGSGA